MSTQDRFDDLVEHLEVLRLELLRIERSVQRMRLEARAMLSCLVAARERADPGDVSEEAASRRD